MRKESVAIANKQGKPTKRLYFTHTNIVNLLIFSFFMLSANVSAQSEQSASRGLQSGASYSISDIESINNTNGNVMFNIPLASLPAGRGGISAGVSLVYNSKMFDTLSGQNLYQTPPGSTQSATILKKSGGWHYGYGYTFTQKSRGNYYANPVGGVCYSESNPDYRYLDAYKFVMGFPDGGSHEFVPSHYYYQVDTENLDGYYPVDINGVHRNWVNIYAFGDWQTCDLIKNQVAVGTNMVFHTEDGTNLRLIVVTDGDNDPTNNYWVLVKPDGSRVTKNEPLPGGGTADQRIYDRNGNFVSINEGLSQTVISDQLGRSLTITKDFSTNQDTITTAGFNNETLSWTVKWTDIGISRRYKLDTDEDRNDFTTPGAVGGVFRLVDEIILPAQAGGQKYEFEYNGKPNGDTSPYSDGFGEVKQIKLPSGAYADYKYELDGLGATVTSWQTVMHNPITEKTLTYQTIYDGVPETKTEKWIYNIGRAGSTITNPDGSFNGASYSDPYDEGDGIVRGTSTNNSVTGTELYYGGYQPLIDNSIFKSYRNLPYLKHTTIRDASGTLSKTAITEFAYDYNGNLLRVKEYDWVDYANFYQNGVFTIPSNAVLKRVTENKYYNPAPEIIGGQVPTGNVFYALSPPGILNAIKSTEVKDGNGNPVSRTEFIYDNNPTALTIGNLTETRSWDSTKQVTLQGEDGNGFKLVSGNFISAKLAYDQYGNPTQMTDAKNVTNTIAYGSINTPGGTVSGLYPTQTITAYGTAIQRTQTAAYDFYTGLSTTATDVDNNLTSGTEYDALGRPLKVKMAVGTANEIWTQSEYDVVNRRIVVRSDLFVKGDGKKIAVQHFDQMGRVRLTRSIENNAAENPYNENDGIKVQTRYRYDNPANPASSNGSYTLTSNPYRAATSGAAANEESMGWTLGYADKTGTYSKAETFAGKDLPAAFGGNNANSTGVIITNTDAERMLVTDQAGKQRISKTNALGQLTNVWEIKAAEAGQTEAVTFGTSSFNGLKTSYNYDTLNNLTTVNQGVQTRTFTYSSLSRLKTANNPESGAISYVYDENGNLTGKTDARSITTSYTYDALNRVTFRDYSDATPDVTYTYDDKAHAKGKLTKVTNANSTTEYQVFDELGRVKQSQQWTDGVAYGTPMEYTYNFSGAMVEQKYPSGRVVKTTLDADGMLAQVQSAKTAAGSLVTYASQFKYTAAGAVSSVRLGNGRFETTQFNSRLQPTQIGLGYSATDTGLLKLGFAYNTAGQNDNNGNVLSQTITAPTEVRNNVTYSGFTATQTYTYDSLNRIRDAKEMIGTTQQWKQTFDYDRYGNRRFDEANTTTIAKNCTDGSGAVVCAGDVPVVNPQIDVTKNRLVGYTFDAAGNTKIDAMSRQFIYDAENKQIEVKDSQNTSIGKYYYDGDGKRVKKVVPATGETTIFIYDASGMLVAEYSTVTNNNPQVSYLTSDHLGSPRINTDAGGAVTARHDYQPFGEEINRASYGADDVRKKFTGYEKDEETDLDFAQARYFNSEVGRFSSPDDFFNDTDVADPQSWNLYVYVRNNPLRFIDPTGEEIWISFTETITETDADGNEVQKQVTRRVQYLNGGLFNEDGSEYEGSNEYALKALDYINALTQDRVLGAMIYDLVKSKKQHTIMKNPSSPLLNETKKTKEGSTVYWSGEDHNIGDGKGGNMNQRAVFTLAHELLGHSWFIDKGREVNGGINCYDNGKCYADGDERTPSTGANLTVSFKELNAIDVENRARKLLGGQERFSYGLFGDVSEFLHGDGWNPRILKPGKPVLINRSRH